MVGRCGELGLRLRGSEEEARLEFTTLVTARTMSHCGSACTGCRCEALVNSARQSFFLMVFLTVRAPGFRG